MTSRSCTQKMKERFQPAVVVFVSSASASQEVSSVSSGSNPARDCNIDRPKIRKCFHAIQVFFIKNFQKTQNKLIKNCLVFG